MITNFLQVLMQSTCFINFNTQPFIEHIQVLIVAIIRTKLTGKSCCSVLTTKRRKSSP